MKDKDHFLPKVWWSFRLYSVLCLPFSRISCFFPYRQVLLVSLISFNSFCERDAYRQLQSITTVAQSFAFRSDKIQWAGRESENRARPPRKRLSPRRATLATDWSRASRESNQTKLVSLYFHSSNLHCMSKQRHYAAQIWLSTARQNSFIFNETLFCNLILEKFVYNILSFDEILPV